MLHISLALTSRLVGHFLALDSCSLVRPHHLGAKRCRSVITSQRQGRSISRVDIFIFGHFSATILLHDIDLSSAPSGILSVGLPGEKCESRMRVWSATWQKRVITYREW